MNPTKPSETRTAEEIARDIILDHWTHFEGEDELIVKIAAAIAAERAKPVELPTFTDGQILDMFNEWHRSMRCWYDSKDCFQAGFKAALKMIKEGG